MVEGLVDGRRGGRDRITEVRIGGAGVGKGNKDRDVGGREVRWGGDGGNDVKLFRRRWISMLWFFKQKGGAVVLESKTFQHRTSTVLVQTRVSIKTIPEATIFG